jgi:hypothetical protein
LNAYAYALADPINRKDPTGHIPQWGAIVAGIAGTAIGLLTGGIGSALALATLTKATTIGLGVVSITSGAASAALDLVGRKSDDSALQIAAVGFAFVSGFAGGLAIQGRAGVGLPRQPKYSKLPLPRKSATPTPPPAKPMIDLNSNYVDVTTRGPRANSLISGIADGMSGIDPRIKPGYRPLPNTPATARFHRYWLTTGEPTGVGNMYHNPNQTLVRRTGETSVNLAYYILGLRG